MWQASPQVVLTDGDEYRIYNAHAPVDVDAKLFRTVRLSEDLERAAATLGLLSRTQLQGNALEALWKLESAERKVTSAVEALFAPEPTPWLVRRLAKMVEGVSESEVRGALTRIRLGLSFAPASVPAQVSPVEPAAAAPASAPGSTTLTKVGNSHDRMWGRFHDRGHQRVRARRPRS